MVNIFHLLTVDLPYYIGGTIKDRSKLLVQTVEGMSDRFNIDIRNLSEVSKSINP